MEKRHINIPIFIPHLGCPNNCVFCNQRSISGRLSFDTDNVKNEIDSALRTSGTGNDIEIAFFGGSFTGIERSLMIKLLATAYSYIERGLVSSIRLSTRPDYIDEEILGILKKYGVGTVELGIQSMNDRVLEASKRGHTARRTELACRLITGFGFSLVGQMMTALPLSTVEDEIFTARRICEMGASGARIYPTMVFSGTELQKMTAGGLYTPPSLEESVHRTGEALYVFIKNGVPVIRIGLHSGESLYTETGICAGAFHPAMGELCENEVYYKLFCEELAKYENADFTGKTLEIDIPKGAYSKVIGHKGANRERFLNKCGAAHIKIYENDTLSPFSLVIL